MSFAGGPSRGVAGGLSRGALATAARAAVAPRPSTEPSAVPPAHASGPHASGPPAPVANAALRKEMGALAQENAMLRREVQEVRDSFAKLMIGADALPTGAALPDASWLAAQLMQTQRQVQLLTEALVQRGDLSTELEAALNKLRQPTADGKRSEYADWAASTLRRLRHVQFVEELAAASVPEPPRPAARGRASGRGVGAHR